ncbi:MAG: methyltransferase domain-containing protein [Gammaproteobacteria bacterium]|nr:methyltransferase domain-containing protein [Gammaproteobacteria bacterium]
MSEDTNFDQHSKRFKNNIYDTDKGKIRLKQLLHDLQHNMPVLQQNKKLSILDAGCGMGQVAVHLAKQGHRLTLCDISSDMLDIARQTFVDEDCSASFIRSSAQTLGSEHDKSYDLILFHAVLEWLDQPETIISSLKQRLKPGGSLSLMFYNKNSIIFYNLLKGNFKKVLKQDFKGHPGGLTPVNPIDPDDVSIWLQSNQFTTLKKTGIRVLYDYLNKDLKQGRSIEDIMQMESIYADKSPFNQLARYLHYICELSDK